jgi:uridine kinase
MKKVGEFTVKVEGPTASGKSTFIRDLLHVAEVKTSWKERYSIKRCDEHTLHVRAYREATPKEKGGK